MIRSVTLPPTKSDRFFAKPRCCAVSESLQVECLALEKLSDFRTKYGKLDKSMDGVVQGSSDITSHCYRY